MRRDLPRRQVLLERWVEEHKPDEDDAFGVILYVAGNSGREIYSFGGYVKGWSNLNDAQRQVVRESLRAEARRQLNEWRAGGPA
jgi:type II secretory pathway component GspD/PulD (secretin)